MNKLSVGRAIMLAAGLGGVLVLAVPATATSANLTNRTIRIGSCRASGDFATCVASGSVNDPIRIKMHVKATPNQSISGNWNMVCSKGSGAGGSQGTISGLTPRVKTLRFPMTNPESCTVAGGASLSGGGSIHVYLTARVP